MVVLYTVMHTFRDDRQNDRPDYVQHCDERSPNVSQSMFSLVSAVYVSNKVINAGLFITYIYIYIY